MPDTFLETLDPTDWGTLRAQGHRMLDDMFDYLEQLRERPVWQSAPESTRALFRESLPQQGSDLASVHNVFMQHILPYSIGNTHPGFMGWVHGAGSPVGMLAEMLAAGLNANLGGRDQIPVAVERQIAQWMQELLGFPPGASGVFVTGTSMANLIALWVARTAALGSAVRSQGLDKTQTLIAYASVSAHGCIAKAMDLAGFGTEQLRLIPVDAQQQMQTEALSRAIAQDRAHGLTPFFIVGTAGSVDCGAIDDLQAIATIAARERVYFHVDGAYGALALLDPKLAPKLCGIERADSVAFDFHKWGQVPYDAGFILVRDADLHQRTFAAPSATYLSRATRGMAAGSPWPCDLGPDLSRGFRALKTWFTLKVYGAAKLGAVIANTCALARYLERAVHAEARLELLAPVTLNIVCFRYRCLDSDTVNANIVIALQEAGRVAPSSTRIQGQLAIRAAIVNHRTTAADIDALLAATLTLGHTINQSSSHRTPKPLESHND